MRADSAPVWQEYLKHLGLPAVEAVTSIQKTRSEVVRVRFTGGRELLLKHGLNRQATGHGQLLNEGLAYLSYKESCSSKYFPKCISHDRKNDTLLLEHVEGDTLRNFLRATDDETEHLAFLGKKLAMLHSSAADYPRWASRLLGDFTALIPDPSPLSPREVVRLDHTNISVMTIIHNSASASARLRSITSPYTKTQIHGDLRLDNIIISADQNIRFVDLELSRVGDPLYDVGTLVGSIIEHGALSKDIRPDTRISTYTSSLLVQLSGPIRALVAGYRLGMRQAGLPMDERSMFTSRLSAFTGVHLLHRAVASGELAAGETRLGRFLALTGCEFLRNPDFLLIPIGLGRSI